MTINGQYHVDGGRYFVFTLEENDKILMNGDPIEIPGDNGSYTVAGREDIKAAEAVRVAYRVAKAEYEGSFEPAPRSA